jgi:hypothetical protein
MCQHGIDGTTGEPMHNYVNTSYTDEETLDRVALFILDL